MKCIYCGKEIVNGNMCEECSDKRKKEGFKVSNTNNQNPRENISKSNTFQKLYCRYCGSLLNTDGSCSNFTCQNRNQNENANVVNPSKVSSIEREDISKTNKDDGYYLAYYSNKFSTIFHVIVIGLILSTKFSISSETNIIGGILLVATIILVIPQIISVMCSAISIIRYYSYKKDSSKNKNRKRENILSIINIVLDVIYLFLFFILGN